MTTWRLWFHCMVLVGVLCLQVRGADAETGMREWTGVSGKTIRAAFLERDGEYVRVTMEDGKVGRMPLAQLSEPDQALARKLDNRILREWTSLSGDKVKASLEEWNYYGNVHLRKEDGIVVRVSLDRLIEEDQARIRKALPAPVRPAVPPSSPIAASTGPGITPTTSLKNLEDLPYLPNQVTINIGDVNRNGKDEVLVLTKRSVRAKDYTIGIVTKSGWKTIKPFPVSTYRGYVKGDPGMRVNANIEPDGTMHYNFSSKWRPIRGKIQTKYGSREKTPLDLSGTSTYFSSKKFSLKEIGATANQVIPLKQTRMSPTPGGFLVPPQPMRRVKFAIDLRKAAVDDSFGGDIQTAVAGLEQKVNDTDFFFARDTGIAIEVGIVVISENGPGDQWNAIRGSPPRAYRWTTTFGAGGGRTGGGGIWWPQPVGRGWMLCAAGNRDSHGFGHETGHKYGAIHNADPYDTMHRSQPHVGFNNLQIVLRGERGGSNKALEAEWGVPAIIYDSPLPPHAMYDFANATKDARTPVKINVLDNDFDGNGDELFLQKVPDKSANGGRVSIDSDKKTMLYTPPSGFVGRDKVGYTVVDSTGVANPQGEVQIEVTPSSGLLHHFAMEGFDKEGFKDKGPMGGSLGNYNCPLVTYPGVVGKALYQPELSVGWGFVFGQGISAGGIRDSRTISIWVLFKDEAALKDGHVILCSGGSITGHFNGTASLNGLVIGQLAGGAGFGFVCNTASAIPENSASLRSTEKIKPKTWYHLVMILDREKKMLSAWVNNTPVTTTSGSRTIPDGVIDGGGGLTLFNGYGHKSGFRCQALIDELKIFNGALGANEVAALYAEGKNATVPNITSAAK